MEAFFETLVEKYPDDVDDLRDALQELQKQKITSVKRLQMLKDAQWQRLGLPMGVEMILREEAEAAAAPGSAPAADVATSASAPASMAEVAPPAALTAAAVPALAAEKGAGGDDSQASVNPMSPTLQTLPAPDVDDSTLRQAVRLMKIEKRGVIVLGLSQHGKTTFMNGLKELQKGSILGHGAVGDGSQRCTVEPEIFQLHQADMPTRFLRFNQLPERKPSGSGDRDAQLREYWEYLSESRDYVSDLALGGCVVSGGGLLAGPRVDRSFGQVTGQVAMRMLGTFNYWMTGQGQEAREAESGSQPGAPETEAPALQLVALDTPGVEDSKGEDDDNMMKIIDKVIEMGELTGIVMVSKCGHPITPTWKEQVKRYYSQFPMLASQWIFVHTSADPYAKSSPHRRDRSSFETAMSERFALVHEAMREVTGDKEFAAAHIFIEADTYRAEPLRSYMAQQHNALYSIVASFKPVTISELPFQKGPKLLKMNGLLLSALETNIDSTQATLKELKHDHAELYKMKEEHSKQTAVLRATIREKDLKLFEYDNDAAVDAVGYISETWQFFSWSRGEVELTSKHANYTLSVVDQSGYPVSKAAVENVEILATQDDGCKQVRVRAVMKQNWSSLNAKVVLSSKMRDVRSAEIDLLKAALAPLRKQLEAIQKDHDREEKLLEGKDDSMRQTTLRYETCRRMKDFINMAWSCETYRGMSAYYQQASDPTHTLSAAELVELFRIQWWGYAKGYYHDDFEPVKLN